MPAGYGERKSRAIGCDDEAFGGAGMNMGIEALFGEGDMITTFDDFNGVMPIENFADTDEWETSGWLLT